MKEYCDHMWSFKTTPNGLVKVCSLCGAVAKSAEQPKTDQSALSPGRSGEVE